jgi:hypothetical protein
MVPSFVLTFTLALMVVPKAPALSLSNLLTMPVMPSNNSTATTGKAALLRCVKIALQALDPDSVEAVLALEEDLVGVSVLAVDLPVVVDSVVDSEEPTVDSGEATLEQVLLMEELVLFPPRPTPLQTMPLLVLREVRLSMFAT